MKIKVINTEEEHIRYLEWVDAMFEKPPSPESSDGERLQVILMLIKQYEDVHYPVPKPDPIDAIKSKMTDLGLKNKNLVGIIGSKGYVSAILSKRKPLTLQMAKLFHKELGIPADILLS